MGITSKKQQDLPSDNCIRTAGYCEGCGRTHDENEFADVSPPDIVAARK